MGQAEGGYGEQQAAEVQARVACARLVAAVALLAVARAAAEWLGHLQLVVRVSKTSDLLAEHHQAAAEQCRLVAEAWSALVDHLVAVVCRLVACRVWLMSSARQQLDSSGSNKLLDRTCAVRFCYDALLIVVGFAIKT